MQMTKAGPYIVVSISVGKYSIQDLLTHKTVDTHVSNLCEFRYDSSAGMDPIEIAARNSAEFFVDRISDYGDTAQRIVIGHVKVEQDVSISKNIAFYHQINSSYENSLPVYVKVSSNLQL
jgi:hypothetical protein